MYRIEVFRNDVMKCWSVRVKDKKGKTLRANNWQHLDNALKNMELWTRMYKCVRKP